MGKEAVRFAGPVLDGAARRRGAEFEATKRPLGWRTAHLERA